jgi:CRISPR-associated protein Cas5d
MDKEYEVSVEMDGPVAMFTRPDTGSAPISYPAPTCEAARALFRSVAWMKTAYIEPIRVVICRPVCYMNYTTNLTGPSRHDNPKEGQGYQCVQRVLVNVCYKLYGRVVEIDRPHFNNKGEMFNHMHALQDIFHRRSQNGQFRHPPVLGCRNFPADYFGPVRDETKAVEFDEFIPSFLLSMWSAPRNGKLAPVFAPRWIKKGVLEYAS